MESVGFPFSVSRNFIQLCIHTHCCVDIDFSFTKSLKAPNRGSVCLHHINLRCIQAYMRKNDKNLFFLFLFYMGARRDTWLLEVFFGLYKPAAILHFSVSTVPAEVRTTDCGGSGRGLPVDAHPHIFLDFFISQVVFTFRDPSGRTFGVDKGRLQQSN